MTSVAGKASTDSSDRTLGAVLSAAATAFPQWALVRGARRAVALRSVAAALTAESETIVSVADTETGLGEARLRSELTRTTFQLQMFADLIRDGSYLDPVVVHPDDGHPVAPHPDLRRTSRPLGPVAVFAASNFPLAFSVAGTDTASALAAGCSVVVKAHPGHPETSRLVGRITAETLGAKGAPEGTFAVVYGFDTGPALIRHPVIRAASFTGSVVGGRALFDLAVRRPDPIPFFGELGSQNGLFVLPSAAETRGSAIAAGLSRSVLLGGGQFCTKPGLVLLPAGEIGTALKEALAGDFRSAAPVRMLTSHVLDGFMAGRKALADSPGVRLVAEGQDAAGAARPALFEVVDDIVPEIVLEECFGPVAVVARYRDLDQLLAIATQLPGALTATIHSDSADRKFVESLVSALEPRVGRLVFDQFPTGVSVSPAMHHGGPYPATTDVQQTSVGSAAIRRFLRPISYQNAPTFVLPAELRD